MVVMDVSKVDCGNNDDYSNGDSNDGNGDEADSSVIMMTTIMVLMVLMVEWTGAKLTVVMW